MTNADHVLDVLKDRRGFDHFWDPIDESIKQEIRDKIQDTQGTEYGCLDCIALADQCATFTVEADKKAFFCPYCGNRNFIETGSEWDEVVEDYESR